MKFIKTILNKVLILFILITLINCQSDDGAVSCVPYQNISHTINLNLPQYYKLNNAGGWMYIDAAYGTGNKGLIVVNTGVNYKVYDRNAPHICPTAKTQLIVEGDIKIVCPEDGAEWILTTGQPTKIANRSPRTYQIKKVESLLYINN